MQPVAEAARDENLPSLGSQGQVSPAEAQPRHPTVDSSTQDINSLMASMGAKEVSNRDATNAAALPEIAEREPDRADPSASSMAPPPPPSNSPKYPVQVSMLKVILPRISAGPQTQVQQAVAETGNVNPK